MNNKIKAPKVRLIDPEGNQVGVITIQEAKQKADEFNLDLVEVVPDAKPPVCKIMDFGKFRYQQQKKEKKSKKKQHTIHNKELRMHPNIEEHDINFKLKKAKDFLEKGDHLKIRINFRGRQILHPELGDVLIERIKTELSDIAKVSKKPTQEGKSLIITFIPK